MYPSKVDRSQYGQRKVQPDLCTCLAFANSIEGEKGLTIKEEEKKKFLLLCFAIEGKKVHVYVCDVVLFKF